MAEMFKTRQLPIDMTETEVEYCRKSLLGWYREKRRKLPWRGDAADPESGFVTPPMSAYGTWVSEIMLQQTRVDTVIPYWHRWMAKFPTVEVLSEQTPDSVNAMWAGLGYYRRAQSLLAGAKEIVVKFNGGVPDNITDLKDVPGIGPYTAGAIASIAYNKVEPLVDGNVMRVMARLRALTTEIGNSYMDKMCWKLCRALVDPEDPGGFNQALMDLGATVCSPKSPACETCPLKSICLAQKLVSSSLVSSSTVLTTSCSSDNAAKSIVETEPDLLKDGLPTCVTYFPLKVPKKKAKEVILSVGVFRSQDSRTDDDPKFLFVKRPEGGLLQNQWEFPSVVLWQEEKLKGKGKSLDRLHMDDVDTGADALWSSFPDFLRQEAQCSWEATSSANSAVATPQSLFSMRPSLIGQTRTVVSAPIVHVFTHQRHTMHVHITDVEVTYPDSILPIDKAAREAKWMTAREIKDAGITTGCKKVLEAVVGGDAAKGGKSKQRATASSSEKPSKKKLRAADAGIEKSC